MVKHRVFIGVSFNGRTVAFEAAYTGSNPVAPSILLELRILAITSRSEREESGSIPLAPSKPRAAIVYRKGQKILNLQSRVQLPVAVPFVTQQSSRLTLHRAAGDRVRIPLAAGSVLQRVKS